MNGCYLCKENEIDSCNNLVHFDAGLNSMLGKYSISPDQYVIYNRKRGSIKIAGLRWIFL